MRPEIFEEVDKMTEDQKKELLNTTFPEELEKEAAAEVETTLLADALYTYGWLQGQRSLAEVDGLDKVAADDLKAHEAAEKQASDQIESCLTALGTPDLEDPIQLHKEAQVAAALIFEGFSDSVENACMDKEAAASYLGKAKAMASKGLAKMKGAAGAAAHKGAKAGRKAMGLAKKHKGKLMGGAAIAGGLYAGKKYMEKKSSEWTPEDIVEIASEVALDKQSMINEIADGVEKLAAKGAAKGKKLHDMASKSSKSSKSSASSKSS